MVRPITAMPQTLVPTSVLVGASIAVKKQHDQGNSYKGQYFIGAGLQFSDLVHYHHGGKHGSVQADMALRVLHLDPKATRRRLAPQLGGGSVLH